MASLGIEKKIDDWFRSQPQSAARAYIGASSVGKPCEAYLALSFRGFPDVEADPQLQRIFRDGHRIEDVVIADLRNAGIEVLDRGEDGKQFEFKGGRIVGHADGIIVLSDGRIVLEVKSMNANKFKEFKEKGVARSHPLYWLQCQALMGMSSIYRAVLVAYNKNSSSYHDEIIEFDLDAYNNLLERAARGASGEVVRGFDVNSQECAGCFKRTSCWHPEQMLIAPSCLNCAHYVLDDLCRKHGVCLETCSTWEVWRVQS